MPRALIVIVHASWVVVALLLLVLLPGTLGWWVPPQCLGLQAAAVTEGVGGMGGGLGASATSRVVGFMGTVAVSGGAGDMGIVAAGLTGVVGPAAAATTTAFQFPGCICCCRWEARAMYSDSPHAIGFSGIIG